MSDFGYPTPSVKKPVFTKKFIRKWGWRLATYALMLLLAVPFVFPFWWMFTSAFKSIEEVFVFPPPLLPEVWRWQNFIDVFTYQPFARQYLNSLYVTVVTTLATLLISSLAGYGFARIKFRGSSFFFLLLLSSLMMPPEVTIIPNFSFMQFLGLIDTHVPLILLPTFGAEAAVATFIMRQYFLSIPKEIEEAAMIDGLNRFGIFWHIALGMARPALATVAILTALHSWNAFLEPLIFIDTLEKFTLPVALRNFTDSYGYPLWNIQLAATTLSVLPVLILFIVAQRQVIRSFALSGVKG